MKKISNHCSSRFVVRNDFLEISRLWELIQAYILQKYGNLGTQGKNAKNSKKCKFGFQAKNDFEKNTNLLPSTCISWRPVSTLTIAVQRINAAK